MKAAFLKSALPFLLLMGVLATRPAAAQQLTPMATDSLAGCVAAHTSFLTDAIRLSPRQRREMAALLTRQLSQPVLPAAWLQVLSLRQYQAWLRIGGPMAGPTYAEPGTEALLAGRME